MNVAADPHGVAGLLPHFAMRVASACQCFEEVGTERNSRVSDGNTSHFSLTLEKELAEPTCANGPSNVCHP